MTQKQIIFKLLRDKRDWVVSFDLQKVNTDYGWLGTSADRQARQMVEDGVIDRQRRGKYSFFRAKEFREFGKPKKDWRTKKKEAQIEEEEKSGQGKFI